MSLHINENVIWNETAEGVSLYHIETGEFRTLNATAAQIWVLLADDGERNTVINRLSLLFARGSKAIGTRIRADVDAFIDAMVGQGLLDEKVPA